MKTAPEKKRSPIPSGGRKAGFGRVKGTPNKATQEIRTICRELTFQNPVYVANIKKALENRTLDAAVHVRVLEYGWGKTKQEVEITVPENPALTVARAYWNSLTPEEQKIELDFVRRRRAITARIIDVTPGD